jgi:hypothetical protein
MDYTRPHAATLARRLAEPRRFIQAVAGPRQVGKTTLVQQVIDASDRVARFASADEPTLRGPGWIAQQWDAARLLAADAGKSGAVLVLDEIQKIPGWSETVKRLWDEDTRARRPLRVVLLGSAPLLISRGLAESRQQHDAGALSGAAGGGGHDHRAAEICRPGGAQSWFQPQVAGVQYRADDGRQRPYTRRGSRRP